jgi:hypothetical protein
VQSELWEMPIKLSLRHSDRASKCCEINAYINTHFRKLSLIPPNIPTQTSTYIKQLSPYFILPSQY